MVLAIGKSTEALNYRFGRDLLRVGERHTTIFGRHYREHRGRGDGGSTAKCSPLAFGDAVIFLINLYPQRHHIAAGGAANNADTVGNIIFLVEQNVAGIKEMIFDRIAIDPIFDVAGHRFFFHSDIGVGNVAVSDDRELSRETIRGRTEST